MRRLLLLTTLIGVLAAGCAPTADRTGDGLLEVDDVRGLPGAPSALTTLDDAAIGLAVDPDPRGPCGAPVNATAASGTASFGNSDVVITQQLIGVADAAGFLDAVRSDLQPGCPPYTKTNVVGATQRMALVDELDSPVPGGVVFAATATLDDRDPVHLAFAAAESAGTVTVITVFSFTQLQDDFVAGLLAAATRKLEAASNA